MAHIIKLVIAVIVGNLCTAGLALLALNHGLNTKFFYSSSAKQEPAASSAVSAPASSIQGWQFMARVPIPGHPIEYCLGPDRELNNAVQTCTTIKVMTVYDNDPIPNPVAHARETLREVCEGEQGPSMTREEHQEWCDLHSRMQLYGDSIRIQPATRIN
jgi:hypothetical protein